MDKEPKAIPILRDLSTAVIAGVLLAWLIMSCAGCKLYVCDTAPASPVAPN